MYELLEQNKDVIETLVCLGTPLIVAVYALLV